MTEKEWDELADKLARQVYNGKLKGELHPETVRATAKTLFEAITTGYGTELPADEIKGNDVKHEPLRQLYKNTFHFSGAKNWNQLREINALLRDDKGELRPFESFRKDVLAISKTYNQAYLQSEYQHAITAADSIAKWDKIQREKAALPWLEYTSVSDDRVRPEHAALNGTVKRVDDPFWNVYYPPNGWRCRCKVRQRARGPEQEPGKLPPLKKMFQVNLGKTGVVFSDKHPYFESMPSKVKKKVMVVSEKMLTNDLNPGFNRVFTDKKTGGHLDVAEAAYPVDLSYNTKWGKVMAKNGYQLEINPHSNIDGVKNPELTDKKTGLIGDFKQPENDTHSSLQKTIRYAAKQKCNFAVVVLAESNFSISEQIRAFNAAFQSGWNTSVDFCFIIYSPKNVVKFTRAEVQDKSYIKKLKAAKKAKSNP